MAKAFLDYDCLLQDALRGVVRDALAEVAARGFLGNHHFFIAFRTGHPGVDIPPYLRAQYPDEMTIVLQNQFSGLEVSQDAFSVTLGFNKVPARLTVPFAALTRFTDPPANFGLQLVSGPAAGPLAAPGDTGPAAAQTKIRPQGGAKDSARAEGDSGSAKVVAIDSFRKS